LGFAEDGGVWRMMGRAFIDTVALTGAVIYISDISSD
jgi:hypothetical protein